jgi:hypothetical protein
LTVTVPPRTEDDSDLAERVAALEALIEEARRRTRRRRRLYAAGVLVATGTGFAVSSGIGGGGPSLGKSAHRASPRPLLAQPVQGRWGPSHGPDGGALTIAVDPVHSRIVYAGGWGDVFKSTNGGASWKSTTHERWTRVSALALAPSRPSTVYAGTDRGIAKTVDAGHHWRMVNRGLLDGTKNFPRRVFGEGFVASLVVDSGNPRLVYAITGIGLFRTTDGGARWTIIGPALYRERSCAACHGKFYGYEVSAAIDPDHARTIYASWSRGVAPRNLYVSTDGGGRWRRVHAHGSLPPIPVLTLDGDPSGTLFAVSGDYRRRGVVKSADGGTTWTDAGLTTQSRIVLSTDPGDRGALYATSGDGLRFESRDRGATWTPTAYSTVAAAAHDPSRVYALDEAGVVESVDGGRTWTVHDNGIVSTLVASLAIAPGSPGIMYAGTLGGGIFTSSNGGRSWQLAWTGPGQNSVIALAVSPHGAIYAGTRGNGLFESVDGGGRWSATALSTGYVTGIAFDPVHAGTMFVVSTTANGYAYGAGRTIRETVDGGATWRKVDGPGRVQTVAVDPRTGRTLFAGATRGLYRSTDGGGTWNLVASGSGYPRPRPFVAVAIDPADPRIVYAGNGSDGVFKSSDGGDTWTAANVGLKDKSVEALAIDPRDPRVLYVSTQSNAVFRSTDGATSWQRLDLGLPADGVATFAIDPTRGTVYAGTWGDGVIAFGQ